MLGRRRRAGVGRLMLRRSFPCQPQIGLFGFRRRLLLQVVAKAGSKCLEHAGQFRPHARDGQCLEQTPADKIVIGQGLMQPPQGVDGSAAPNPFRRVNHEVAPMRLDRSPVSFDGALKINAKAHQPRKQRPPVEAQKLFEVRGIGHFRRSHQLRYVDLRRLGADRYLGRRDLEDGNSRQVLEAPNPRHKLAHGCAALLCREVFPKVQEQQRARNRAAIVNEQQRGEHIGFCRQVDCNGFRPGLSRRSEELQFRTQAHLASLLANTHN